MAWCPSKVVVRSAPISFPNYITASTIPLSLRASAGASMVQGALRLRQTRTTTTFLSLEPQSLKPNEYSGKRAAPDWKGH